jgi:hypothetical protein
VVKFKLHILFYNKLLAGCLIMFKRTIFVFITILVFTLYLQELSFDVYSQGARDNFYYYNFFEYLKSNNPNFFTGFFKYHNLTGASEPIFYFVSYLISIMNVSYVSYISILNIFFIACLSYFLASFKNKFYFYFLAITYISCDFYVFVLLSEVHRLKLGFAFSFLLLASLMKNKKLVFYYVMMIMSHFQTGMLSLLFFNKIKLRFKNVAIIVLILLPLMPMIYQKFIAYIRGGMQELLLNILSTSLLSLLFISVILIITRKVNKQYLALIVGCIFASAIIGKGRMNIFIFESSIVYLFYLCFFKCSSIKNKSILSLVVLIVSVFSLYKVNVSYDQLMGWTWRG